jgi:hypothetical protein
MYDTPGKRFKTSPKYIPLSTKVRAMRWIVGLRAAMKTFGTAKAHRTIEEQNHD